MMDVERISELFRQTTSEIGKVLAGQEDLVEGVVLAIFSEGHVLIEGVPGLGKTLLVNTLGRVIDCGFKRVQFTPDLMPSDLTGHSMFHLGENRLEFIPGPIFTNLLLADEVNRAPAKTQSALLEAMQELQVTIDGRSHPLNRPFFAMATQNPLEQEGTYPLPEAQLDRFMFKLLVDYPSPEAERQILRNCAEGKGSRHLDTYGLQTVLTASEILEIQHSLNAVIVEPSMINYIANIIARSREWHSISVGASPRAGVNLLQASRSLAASEGRNFVVPDDVKSLAPWVLRHRLRIRSEAEIEGTTPDDAVREILESVEAPRR
jgi:MoxR-like ATPase